jgi:LPXTG-motif cell wall-anchored protein
MKIEATEELQEGLNGAEGLAMAEEKVGHSGHKILILGLIVAGVAAVIVIKKRKESQESE